MAYILPTGTGYECLCGATYTHYTCRCVDGCGEDNMIDVKGNLIK